jgi:hypothetical protein
MLVLGLRDVLGLNEGDLDALGDRLGDLLALGLKLGDKLVEGLKLEEGVAASHTAYIANAPSSAYSSSPNGSFKVELY